MKLALVTISFLALCAACTTKPENKDQNQTPTQQKTEKSDSRTMLSFTEPIQVDSTVYAMIPLTFGDADGRDGRGSFVFKSSGNEPYYWNIIFLNTQNRLYHLLDSGRKMLIKEYDRDGISTEVSKNNFTLDKYLFYEVITNDANKDGKLDDDDPTYLFMSDEAGNNFKQISPGNYDLRNWKVIKQTSKVLMYAVNSNGAKANSKNEQVKPFIYDLKTGAMAGPMFSDNFVEGLKKTFDKQWTSR